MLHYYNNESSVSYGKIKKIDNLDIIHSCGSGPFSSGSLILSLKYNKVIGIHISNHSFPYGKGLFFE